MANLLTVEKRSRVLASVLVWLTSLPLLFVFIAGCRAEPPTGVDQCRKQFLSRDSAWEARSFDGEVLRSSSSGIGTFTPIEKIYVQAGKLYVQTWVAEPMAATISASPKGIVIGPRYKDWLGIDDQLGREVKKVIPYANSSARHILSVEGGCKEPTSLAVDVYLSSGQKRHRVLFRKVPTVHIEI